MLPGVMVLVLLVLLVLLGVMVLVLPGVMVLVLACVMVLVLPTSTDRERVMGDRARVTSSGDETSVKNSVSDG